MAPTTLHTMRLTVCAPLDLLPEANAVAGLVGESDADLGTFIEASHERDGAQYSCISTMVKPVFESFAAGDLPPLREGSIVDLALALKGFGLLNTPGGIVSDLRERVHGEDVISKLGFTPICMEELEQ